MQQKTGGKERGKLKKRFTVEKIRNYIHKTINDKLMYIGHNDTLNQPINIEFYPIIRPDLF